MPQASYDVAIVGAGFSGPMLAANIAEKGVHPKTGDRLKVALVEAGPYLKGTPRPGYGHPVRRQRFTNLEDPNRTLHWKVSCQCVERLWKVAYGPRWKGPLRRGTQGGLLPRRRGSQDVCR